MPTPQRKTTRGPRIKPFKGPTPPHVFQTIDTGSGKGEYIMGAAHRNWGKGRRYAAVDHSYGFEPHDRRALALRASGIKAYPQDSTKHLLGMAKRGERTRHINIDMPNPWRGQEDPIKFVDYLRAASQVLFPNGKIFVTSEDRFTFDSIREIAAKEGYKIGRVRVIQYAHDKKKTHMMTIFKNSAIYAMTLTLGLKKAIPDKAKRKAWPRGA